MSTTNETDKHSADHVQTKCADVLDKLLSLSAGGASGELPFKAASALAADLAQELASLDRLSRRG
ncbi:MAG: hypothetical protein JNN22_10955 [Rhodospirillales bacterium]|nr:hypothetical protein [Rhodospirillales bacterium]